MISQYILVDKRISFKFWKMTIKHIKLGYYKFKKGQLDKFAGLQFSYIFIYGKC